MEFVHDTRVRFHQADPAGVLFYGRLFELIEEAYEGFCAAAGIDIDALMRQHVVTTPVIHVEADYLAPIRVGEPVRVFVHVDRVGTTSIALTYRFQGSDGTPRATAVVVHVYVDASTWNKVAIPDDVRAALGPYTDP